jgi:hypothetical protein
MKPTFFVIAGAAFVLSACASTPESIAPAYISDLSYQNLTCEQLATEMTHLNAAYATAATEQHEARENDTIGVILLGLPVSSLSGGNVAPQIANIKGNQAAIDHVAIQKNCTGIVAVQGPAKKTTY